MVANIDYDDFKGKLGVGRVHSGSLRKGQTVGLGRPGGEIKTGKVSELFVFDNLGRTVGASRFGGFAKGGRVGFCMKELRYRRRSEELFVGVTAAIAYDRSLDTPSLVWTNKPLISPLPVVCYSTSSSSDTPFSSMCGSLRMDPIHLPVSSHRKCLLRILYRELFLVYFAGAVSGDVSPGFSRIPILYA